jgi:hypothetical protein
LKHEGESTQAARRAEQEREARTRQEYVAAIPDEINSEVERAVQKEVTKMRAELMDAYDKEITALRAQIQAGS